MKLEATLGDGAITLAAGGGATGNTISKSMGIAELTDGATYG